MGVSRYTTSRVFWAYLGAAVVPWPLTQNSSADMETRWNFAEDILKVGSSAAVMICDCSVGRHRIAIAWLLDASLFYYGWWNSAYL
jgi:hypothetical protein